jgi:ASC-1-like (ASCH) protein
MIHRLKTVQPYFDDIKSGGKKFELCYNKDRNFQVGDLLVLEEWDENTGYTGNIVQKLVSYVLTEWPDFGLKEGYCILS